VDTFRHAECLAELGTGVGLLIDDHRPQLPHQADVQVEPTIPIAISIPPHASLLVPDI
jgi:hypothetical protein